MQERRRQPRRKMGFYFKVLDTDTEEIFGHMNDVSMLGLMLDCLKPIPVNLKFRISLEATPDVSDTEFIDMVVQSIWCRKDPITPNVYNVGFSILEINPHDADVLQRIIDQYGST